MKNSEDGSSESSKCSGLWKARYQQAAIMFVCMCVAYIVRTSASVAVIAMTNQNSTIPDIETYDWDKEIQDYFMASFYWGYLFIQIPAGHFSTIYGGKYFLAFSILTNGVISFFIPFVIRIGGWKAVCVLRGIQGFCQGFVIPSVYSLLGKWAPFNERNRLVNFVYSGCNLGTITAMSAAGFISNTSYGWPMVFYLIGIICILGGLLWLFFGANSPAEHKTISHSERTFIETSLGQNAHKKVLKLPWGKILTSIPIYAVLIAHIGAVWGFFVMMTETPSFLSNILKLNVAQSGIMSALPYVIAWICSVCTSFTADFLINSKKFTVRFVRKAANTIGTWGPATGMIILTYIPPGRSSLAIVNIICIVALDSTNTTGFLMNHIDLSPNYAGVLVSIANCLAAGIGTFAPMTAGWILKEDPTDITRWRILFFIAAAVYFFSNLIFLIFGKAEKQPWDKLEDQNEKEVGEELIVYTAVTVNADGNLK